MIKHVVRYFIGTEEYCISLPNLNDKISVLCRTDVDWGRNISNRRSRTGFLVTVNGGPVVWTSKLHTFPILSTSEGEFNALAYSIKDLKWLCTLFMDVNAIESAPIDTKQDNLG